MSIYDVNAEQIYILGLVPASQIKLAKLSISPNSALWFVLFLLILVSLLPVLKLRFVSAKYAFSRGDVSQIGLGLIVALGMASIGTVHQFFYGYLIESKTAQATNLHKRLSSEFNTEISSLERWAAVYQTQLVNSTIPTDKCKTIEVTRAQGKGVFQSCVDQGLVLKGAASTKANKHIIEGTFILDEQGMFAIDTPTTWKTEKLLVGRDIELTHRQYFQKAMNCDVWGDTLTQANCKDGLVFERINNVRDGRKNTQFAIPMFDSVHSDDKHIFSFGPKLRTFFHRVMPKNFGFLVFDQSGSVLFHSDEERSLIENVFVETDNNKLLHAFVENQAFSSRSTHSPINFETEYRGQSHLFVVGDLFTDNVYKDADLTLVVFYDQTEAELNNMLLLFMAVVMFLLMIIPIFIFFRYATSQSFWATFLYFNPKHIDHYAGWAVLILSATIFCLFSMGIVFDLTLRLALWLFVTALVFVLIINSLGTDKTVLRGTIPKMRWVILLGSIFGFTSLGIGAVIPNYDRLVNVLFFVVGLAVFVWGIRYQQRSLAKKRKVRHNLYSVERYNTAFVFFLLSTLFLASAVPANLIIKSANGYLLQHQATMERQHLIAKTEFYEAQLEDYSAIVGETAGQSYEKENWLNTCSLAQMYPGYGNWIVPAELSDSNGRYRDRLIQVLVSNIAFADEFLAKISHIAKSQENGGSQTPTSSNKTSTANGLTFDSCVQIKQADGKDSRQYNESSNNTLLYLPDAFIFNASISNMLLVIVLLMFQMLITYRLLELMVVRRLFGDHLTNDFRIAYPREHSCQEEKWQDIKALLAENSPQHLLLLHCSGARIQQQSATLKIKLFEGTVLNIKNLLAKTDSKFDIEATIAKASSRHFVTVALEGLDELAFLPKERNLALALIQKIMVMPKVHLVIVADTAPIYRLIKQDEYPHLAEESVALATEELGWANIFSGFKKVYDWTPTKKYMPRDIEDVAHLIENEANGWPELRQIEAAFNQYHQRIKLGDIDAEINESNLKAHWRPSQIIAFFAVHGGALYRMKWELCTKNERFLLYQLASGANVNPLNSEVVDHLMRRGYIYRDAGWHIINESFKQFILHAEREESIHQWQAYANTGIWTMLRIPIFTLVLIAITVFSSGQAIDSILGIMTALLGLIPLLLRNVSLLKGGSTNIGE